MKEIQLGRGYTTLVDDEDYEWLNKIKWNANVNKSNHVSAVKGRQEGCPFIRMSRMILNVTDPKLVVDHKDRNPLNNQKSNLRICTHQQNLCNMSSNKGSTSMFVGVCFDRSKGNWMARIKGMYIGRFKKEEDAALAYNIKAAELHGEFANLNKIPTI